MPRWTLDMVQLLGRGEIGLGLVLSEGLLMPCIWNEEVIIESPDKP